MNATEMIPLKSGSPVKLYGGSRDIQTVAPSRPKTFGPFLVTTGHTIGVLAFGTAAIADASTGVAVGIKILSDNPTSDKFINSWEASVLFTTFIVTVCSVIGFFAVAVSSFCKKRALDNAQRYVRIGS